MVVGGTIKERIVSYKTSTAHLKLPTQHNHNQVISHAAPFPLTDQTNFLSPATSATANNAVITEVPSHDTNQLCHALLSCTNVILLPLPPTEPPCGDFFFCQTYSYYIVAGGAAFVIAVLTTVCVLVCKKICFKRKVTYCRGT